VRLLRLAETPFPLDVEAAFGRSGPLVLEIGFGDGRHPAMLARAHPEWNLLGAEVSSASVWRALRRFKREGVENVRVVRATGAFVVRNLVPRRGLFRVYVNFPDPWPKKRHQGRRLLRAPFFRLLSTRLADGGALYFTTDHAEYFAFAQEEARKTGLFRVEVAPPPPEALATKYALKWKEAGRRFYHAVFYKTGEAFAAFPPIERWNDVPHAILEGSLPAPEAFHKVVHPFAGGTAVLLEAARRLPQGLYVFARVEEEELAQHVLLEVRESAHGVYAGLRRFGDVIVTPGVRQAVAALVGWLEAEGLSVKKRSY